MPYTRLSKMPLAWKNLMEARKGRVDHNAAALRLSSCDRKGRLCVSRILTFVLGSIAQIPLLEANESLQLTLSAGSESNVTRGFHDPHILSSGYLEARLQGTKLYRLGLNDSLLVSGSFNTRRYGQTSGFDQTSAGLSAALNHKFGFGAFAPQLNLSIGHSWSEARGEARDHETSSVSLELSKRLSPAWLVYAGVGAEENRADPLQMHHRLAALGYDPAIALPFEIYNFDSQSLSAGVEYTFENGLMLSGQYSRIDGHTISSTAHPDEKIYKVSKAFYLESAFRHDWYAYQLESNTNAFGLAISLPVARDAAVDITANRYDIAAPTSKNYDNSEVAVSITWGF